MNAPSPFLDGSEMDAALATWSALDGADLLAAVLTDAGRGRSAVVSSFGAESAVLLHMVAQIDPSTPVLFVDTGRLFPETLVYRNTLQAHLGLTDVRTVTPASRAVDADDPHGILHRSDPNACCRLRKITPYTAASAAFGVLITGRKRYHGGDRAALETVERAGAQIKINPLAYWDGGVIAAAFARHTLPHHPLERAGYHSIGCAVCTRPGRRRTGRWAGSAKTECGIHLDPTTAKPAATLLSPEWKGI